MRSPGFFRSFAVAAFAFCEVLCDRFRVFSVGLLTPATPLRLAVRLNLANVEPALHQKLGELSAEPVGAFDTDPTDLDVHRFEPRKQINEALRRRFERWISVLAPRPSTTAMVKLCLCGSIPATPILVLLPWCSSRCRSKLMTTGSTRVQRRRIVNRVQSHGRPLREDRIDHPITTAGPLEHPDRVGIGYHGGGVRLESWRVGFTRRVPLGVEFLVDEGSSQAAVGVTADAVVSVEPGNDLLAGSFIVGSTDR